MIVVTAAEMRAMDRWTIDHGPPGTVLLERAGAGATRVLRARWRKFGGRKAIGFGRMVVESPPGFTCTRHSCPGHGRRFKVVLSRPSRCADNGDAVWYGKVAFYTTKRLLRIRAGGLFASYKPPCGLSDPKPV